MSTGGESEVASEVPEERRVRWRYVKGGLRMVMVLCAGRDLVSDCADCDVPVSAETGVIAGA